MASCFQPARISRRQTAARLVACKRTHQRSLGLTLHVVTCLLGIALCSRCMLLGQGICFCRMQLKRSGHQTALEWDVKLLFTQCAASHQRCIPVQGCRHQHGHAGCRSGQGCAVKRPRHCGQRAAARWAAPRGVFPLLRRLLRRAAGGDSGTRTVLVAFVATACHTMFVVLSVPPTGTRIHIQRGFRCAVHSLGAARLLPCRSP